MSRYWLILSVLICCIIIGYNNVVWVNTTVSSVHRDYITCIVYGQELDYPVENAPSEYSVGDKIKVQTLMSLDFEDIVDKNDDSIVKIRRR